MAYEIANDAEQRNSPQLTFRQFRAWLKDRSASLAPAAAEQAERCVLHTRCLEMNLRHPSHVLIAAAGDDFARLEALLHT